MRDALGFPIPVSERISFIYWERSAIDRDGHALVVINKESRTVVPIGRTTVLLLGPGCRVTHAAISLIALEGALALWVGEAGVRLYAGGNPRADAKALLHQAAMRLQHRLTVAKRIFKWMWGEAAPANRSVDQLRGIEGSKVKALYPEIAQRYGVEWQARKPDTSDPLNLAINTATSTLYGLAEAVILALGYSPAIGFVHAGDPRSFVFDVADTIKFRTVVPLAFAVHQESAVEVERRCRIACRNLFFEHQIAAKLVSIIEDIMDANGCD